jgi:hypothetical protein
VGSVTIGGTAGQLTVLLGGWTAAREGGLSVLRKFLGLGGWTAAREGGLSVLTEILGLGWCGTCWCCIEELAEEED